MRSVTKGAEDEIVISGMSGRFPESESLDELWKNLMSREDMIKVDDRRWPVGVFEVDTFGKLKDISRFDAPFFNFTADQANQCAPDVRVMLEVAWETIVDAGCDPKSLENTPTGVYIGNCIVEAGEALTNNVNTITATGLLNSMHTSLPNKVSEYFKFTGPSETHDTGCSASLYSLDTAVMAMKRGDISAALIGGCNLNLKPQATVALHRMNMVSGGRGCRVYDKSADGYSRAECISLVLLQWRSQAKRIYGRIVNSVTNNDGFKEEGIIFPDSRSQISLLREAYKGTCVAEEDVVYVEAHGTGTQAGDTQECLAVDNFFCSKRSKDKPLLIGSIKSNLGHAEPASGVASLCKVLMSYTKGVIPPNIHLNEINPKLEAVIQGRLKIVTEPTPLEGNGLVSLNAFGFGGSNAHVILLPNENEEKSREVDVFFVNGRTPTTVSNMLDLATQEPKKGLQDLYRGLSTISPDLYPSRGFLLLDSEGVPQKRAVPQEPSPNRRQVWLLLGGLGSQWVGMGRGLMEFQPFRLSVETCQNVLNDLGADVDIVHILCSEDSDVCEDVVSMFVGLTALVIGLIEVLKTAGLKLDGVIGHSLGDTLCGMALGLHSASDIIKSAYARSILIKQRADLRGSMYGVACPASNIKPEEGVSVACYNSPSHVTLAVNSEAGLRYLDTLQKQGYGAKQISSGGFAFHSPSFRSVLSEVTGLMGYMECVARPDNWISTSYSAGEQPTSLGPSFFADNLVNPVYFEENVRRIPEESIVVELSGNSSLLGLLDSGHEKIGLVRYNTDSRASLLAGVGELYVLGALNTPYSLLPPPSYPTPRDTPSLSSTVATGWNHQLQWWVPTLDEFLISSNDAKLNKFVSTYEFGDTSNSLIGKFVNSYSILGRNIIPFSVGVYVAWQSFARANDVSQDNLCVQLTNVCMHQQIDLSLFPSPIKLCVGVLPKTGQFHITTSNVLFMSGSIETHDPLQECGQEFDPESGSLADGRKVLEFYQLLSQSNGVIKRCDLENLTCEVATEKCDNGSSSVDGNLMLLDSHFQLIQLERMQTSPFSTLTGASSIILDGRGFCETNSISKPYPGSCRSDAVWVDGTWFDVLEPALQGVGVSKDNGESCEPDEEVMSENGRKEESARPAEKLAFKGADSVLYSNLLGSSVWLHSKHLTVTRIYPALDGALHVCYATCCLGDTDRCHEDVHARHLAVGILSKSEVLDSTNVDLSQQFFTVASEEYGLPPEVWASLAVSLCLHKVMELNKPISVVIIGDGQILSSACRHILGKRFQGIHQSFTNVSQTPPGHALDQINSGDCVVNLSTDRNLLDVLAATNRCGSAINFIRHHFQGISGMSSLLKNLSVVNFQAAFVKLSSYWTLIKPELQNAAKDFTYNAVLDPSAVSFTSPCSFPGGKTIEVTVHTKCPLIERVICDFFQHRTRFRVVFCKPVCNCKHDNGDAKLSNNIILFVRIDDMVWNCETTAAVPVKTSYSKIFSPLTVRSWLFGSILGSEMENDNRVFVLGLISSGNQ